MGTGMGKSLYRRGNYTERICTCSSSIDACYTGRFVILSAKSVISIVELNLDYLNIVLFSLQHEYSN